MARRWLKLVALVLPGAVIVVASSGGCQGGGGSAATYSDPKIPQYRYYLKQDYRRGDMHGYEYYQRSQSHLD